MSLALVLASAAAPAIARSGASGAPVATASSLGGMVLGLVFVVILILGLAWVLRRMPGAGQRAMGRMRIVASLPVGPRERVLVVQVGNEQLVLGATGQHITLLKTLEQPMPEEPGAGEGFAAILARRISGARQ